MNVDERLREALHTVSTATARVLETTFDRNQLLEVVVKAVAEAVPDSCFISLRDEGSESLTPVAAWDPDPRILDQLRSLLGTRHETRDALFAHLTETKGPLFVPTIDEAQLRPFFPPESLRVLQQMHARGIIVVPLRPSGRLEGMMSVIRRLPERPPLDALDCEIAEHLATHTALALANERLYRERQTLASELAASQFLDAVVENIPDMVFIKDADELRFVRFNRAGEELLGIPRAAMLGKNDYDFFPPSEADFFTGKDRETLAGGSMVDIPEEPIQTRAGPRWLHTKKVPMVDASGTPRFLLGISEDITDRKNALAALKAAVDQAQLANRELEAFAYSVAHDLRNPLRAIDGFSQALLEDYGATFDGTGRAHLERIRGAAQRMATLIDDLLRLSRMTRTVLNPEPVNLSQLAHNAVGQLERLEPRRHVEVKVADEMETTGDPKLLAIVFDNLIGNAWKFSSKVEHARIECGVKREPSGRVVYFVRDNGAGFDMANQSQLFGTFQRLHREDEFPGTGIGLATVKRIIERHGGRIWAEAAVGQGATFFFTLGSGSPPAVESTA